MTSARIRTFLVAFACLVVIEIATRVWLPPYEMWTRLLYLERPSRWVSSNRPIPKVIVWGSSHVQCGVAARVVERQLGLRQNEVLNLGMSNGGPREALYVLDRNPQLLSHASVALIEVDRFMFMDRNANRDLHLYPAWRRKAGLERRLRCRCGSLDKADLAAGWFSATWDQRDTWLEVIDAGLGGLGDRLRRAGRAEPVFDSLGRPNAPGDVPGRSREELSDSSQRIAAEILPDRRLDPEALVALHTLVDRLQGGGATIRFIRMPEWSDYHRLVTGGNQAPEMLWKGCLAQNFPNIPVSDLTASTDTDDPRSFRDGVHLTPTGALRLAPAIAEVIRKCEGERGNAAQDRQDGRTTGGRLVCKATE